MRFRKTRERYRGRYREIQGDIGRYTYRLEQRFTAVLASGACLRRALNAPGAKADSRAGLDSGVGAKLLVAPWDALA